MAKSIIQKNLMKVILGQYLSGPATSIDDPHILPAVQQYKRLVASQLLPLAHSDISRKIPDGPLLASRKLDGEFNAIVFADGELFTVNPGGTVRIGLPFFDELKKLFRKAKIKNAMIAGELYVDLGKEKRCRVHDAISMLRHPANESELKKLKFAIFDIISLNDQKITQPYSSTWTQIQELFGTGKQVHVVETTAINSSKSVDNLFQAWVEKEGAEGIVIRSDTAGSFKLKPLFTLDAVVIGFTESTEERTGLLHDLLLAVRRIDGAYHVLSRVGGGLSEELRRTMLSDLRDMVVESEYAEVNSDHVAYQMVRPEWVIEISCLDLVAQNTRGRPVNRMALKWDANANQYKVIRRLPLVSVISPQFLRMREDKTASIQDTRIQQVSDIVPVPLFDADTNELTLPKSKLMQREIYVKTLRGETLVRKFLLWKTNKENDAENFPGFVAYHADFSPSRKVPLTREVRVSNSETQIIALWHALKEENIKKGWELHSNTGDDIDRIVSTPSIAESTKNESTKKRTKAASKNSENNSGAKTTVASKESKKKAVKKKKTANKTSSKTTKKSAANKSSASTKTTKTKSKKK